MEATENHDYVDLIEKSFINNEPMSEVLHNELLKIYRNIPPQLAKENRKYQISKIVPNARTRDYRDSMNWLLASKFILLIILKLL